jgi:outer membrane biosynthesis protein TonB
MPVSKIIPVELITVKSQEPIPKRKLPPPKPKPKPKPKYTPKPKQAKGIYKALISEYVEELSQHPPAELALPDVSLPEKFSQKLPKMIIPKSEDLFSPEEIFTDIGMTPSAGEEKMVIEDSLPKGTRQSPLESDTGIEWKGKPRKTIDQPPLPKISSKIEGDVQIKFWVDRDGRVSQMIPMKKLDAELESIAFGYLKKWRFESLPPGKDYLQWGIITVKIRLK